jgi:hypothetical protein
MDMVFHAADEDGWAIELFGNAAEVRVKRVARGFIAQKRTAVFGGENEMNVNRGKGLWHGGRMSKSELARQSGINAMKIKRRTQFNAPTEHQPPAQVSRNRFAIGTFVGR